MKPVLIVGLLLLSLNAIAVEFDYQAIAGRHSSTALDAATVAEAKMQGECLVGLKELNFKRKDHFDPIAEWTSFRSISLLEQFPPCEVLIMMEVAQRHLRQAPEG